VPSIGGSARSASSPRARSAARSVPPVATLTDLVTSKVPPHNIEAERAILGSLLVEPEGLPRVLAQLQTSDFYKEGHRKIFDAMLAVTDAGQGLDLLTTADALRRDAALEEIGGPAYLAQLAEEATLLTELPSYCAIIAEKARARDLIRIGTELIGQAYENGRPTRELITDGAGWLEALARRGAPAAEVFPAMTIGALCRLAIPDPTFHVHSWVPAKALSFIVGDSEAYKSWFALLLAMSVAAGTMFLERFPTVQAPTLVISEENGIAEDKRRVTCLGRGHGLDIDALPCHIVSEASFSFDDPLRYAALRRYIDAHRIELVVFDSFVRVHRSKENDAGEMNRLYLDKMKPLIKDGVALVMLHHRRKVQHGPGQPQSTGDSDEIRGSGDIRAATHAVLFLRTVSETQVLVKHNKTRGWRRQDPYVFAVQDPDPGATCLVWEGKPEDALDKSGACREAILLFAAQKGSFARKDLEAELKGRFSKKVVRPLLDELVKAGTPLRKELRGRHGTVWLVYVQQGADPAQDGGQEEVPF